MTTSLLKKLIKVERSICEFDGNELIIEHAIEIQVEILAQIVSPEEGDPYFFKDGYPLKAEEIKRIFEISRTANAYNPDHHYVLTVSATYDWG